MTERVVRAGQRLGNYKLMRLLGLEPLPMSTWLNTSI